MMHPTDHPFTDPSNFSPADKLTRVPFGHFKTYSKSSLLSSGRQIPFRPIRTVKRLKRVNQASDNY